MHHRGTMRYWQIYIVLCLLVRNTRTQCPNNCTGQHVACIGTACVCHPGYELDTGERSCTDIDECSATTSPCDLTRSTCEDYEEGYTCSCFSGYTHLENFCSPINECKTDQHNCDLSKSVCLDEIPSFRCICKAGFSVTSANARYCDGTDTTTTCPCESINECNMNVCTGNNEECTDTHGSYTCSCPSGFDKQGTLDCQDVNECETEGICAGAVGCENAGGSYECTCLNNYIYNSNTEACEDPNQCLLDADNNCDKSSTTCSDTADGFTCLCKTGFEINDDVPTHCDDIDECARETDTCDDIQVCENTKGAFECSCTNGYEWNLGTQTCENLDECMTAQHDCQTDEICVDLDPFFRCDCRFGIANSTGGCLGAPVAALHQSDSHEFEVWIYVFIYLLVTLILVVLFCLIIRHCCIKKKESTILIADLADTIQYPTLQNDKAYY